MKKAITILILLLSFILFVAADIERESIVDIKWKVKYPEGSTHAIYFKHDNTFWHYYKIDELVVDSIMLCRWDLSGDKIYLSCSDTTSQALKIIFFDGKNLTLSTNRENTQYTK